MKMNPLPPQAYTKETLLKAYSWLQNQNDSLKELATTPDILISLFTKAQMNGDSSLDRPSIQNFKQELKNLAGMMGEFETKQENNANGLTNHKIETKHEAASSKPQVHHQAALQAHQTQPSSHSTPQVRHASIHDLDVKTHNMLKDIMAECNLSSETEALRLLVSVGYKKLKNI